MIPLILIGAAIVYAVCSLLAYKATFAYFQKEYPRIAESTRGSDRAIAGFMAAIGPLGLAIAATHGGFFKHGFTTKS
jgi:hypothetical protein